MERDSQKQSDQILILKILAEIRNALEMLIICVIFQAAYLRTEDYFYVVIMLVLFIGYAFICRK
jgi:hypothetical protein